MGNLVVSMREVRESFGFLGKLLFSSEFGEVESYDDSGNFNKLVKKEPQNSQEAFGMQSEKLQEFIDKTVNNTSNTFGPDIPEPADAIENPNGGKKGKKGNKAGVARKIEGSKTIPNYDEVLKVGEENLIKDATTTPRDKGGKEREQRTIK